MNLDEECRNCYGSGRIFSARGGKSDEPASCPLCDGTGRVLTQLGQEIVDLVKLHVLRVGLPT